MNTASLRFFIALALLAGCGGSDSPKAPGSRRAPIFRYIDVAPYGMVRLGDPFASASRLGIELRPGMYRLDRVDGKPVQLGDTQAIFVALTQDRRVCAFHFIYLPDKTLAARIAEYQPDLGPATMSQTDSAGAQITVAAWHDSETLLQLSQTIAKADTTFAASLVDTREGSSSNPCAH